MGSWTSCRGFTRRSERCQPLISYASTRCFYSALLFRPRMVAVSLGEQKGSSQPALEIIDSPLLSSLVSDVSKPSLLVFVFSLHMSSCLCYDKCHVSFQCVRSLNC